MVLLLESPASFTLCPPPLLIEHVAGSLAGLLAYEPAVDVVHSLGGTQRLIAVCQRAEYVHVLGRASEFGCWHIYSTYYVPRARAHVRAPGQLIAVPPLPLPSAPGRRRNASKAYENTYRALQVGAREIWRHTCTATARFALFVV